MKEGKAKSGNRGLVILLCVLGIVIVGLIIGVAINFVSTKNSNSEPDFSPELNEVILDINESYSGNLLSPDGSLVFYNYILDSVEDESINIKQAYDLYEDILKGVDGEAKLNYLSYYASLIYDLEGDMESAVEVVKRFEPEIKDNQYLGAFYYAILRGMYDTIGDDEMAEYYNDMLTKNIPSEVHDDSKEE